MDDTGKKKVGWKQKLIHEAVEYYINLVYLAAFLIAIAWYRRLILANYHIEYTEYWVPLIEAAILAKVIMIGDVLGLGRGLEHKPLILRTVYRTLVFGLWLIVFNILEETVRGLFKGEGLAGGFEKYLSRGRDEFLAGVILYFLAFVPFFAFQEVGRVVGKDKIRAMFFRSRSKTGAGPPDGIEEP